MAKEKNKKPQTPEDIAASFAPPSPEDIAASFAPPDPTFGRGEVAAQALRSGLEGQTAGLSEPLISGAMALPAGAQALMTPEAMLNPEVGPGISRGQFAGHALEEAYGQDVANRRAFKNAMPGVDIGVQIGGAIIPSPLNVGARFAKGAQMVGQGIKGAGLLPSMARSGVEGALGTVGFEGVRQAALKPTGFIKEGEDPSLMDTAELGAAIGAASPLLGKAASLTGKLPKKMLASVGGVKEDVIDSYLQNADKIRNTPGREELVQRVEGAVMSAKDKAQAEQMQFAQQLQDSIEGLKQKVVKGSASSFDILENSNVSIEKQTILDEANRSLNSLMVAGKRPVGQAAESAYRTIESFKQQIAALPDQISAQDAKRILQQIDDDVSYIQTPGSFDENAGQRALKRIRYEIDGQLKERIPEYQTVMATVAKDARMLSDLSKKYGGMEKTISGLQSLSSPQNFARRLQFEQQALALGMDPKKYFQMQAQADALKTFNSQNVGDKVKSLIRGNSESTKAMFTKLSQLADEDFVQWADQVATTEAFDKDFTRGSRNVNLWTILGSMGAGVTAAGDIMTGGIGGALVGAMIDKYGPTITRSVLDQVSKIKGLPTVQKIEQLSLPDSVKNDLKFAFARSLSIGAQNKQHVQVPEEMRAQISDDVMKSGMSNVEKAAILNGLNTNGMLKDADKLLGVTPPVQPADMAMQKIRKEKEMVLRPSDMIKNKKEEEF